MNSYQAYNFTSSSAVSVEDQQACRERRRQRSEYLKNSRLKQKQQKTLALQQHKPVSSCGHKASIHLPGPASIVDKCQDRKIRNRLSAIESRKRRIEHAAMLEAENLRLKDSVSILRQRLAYYENPKIIDSFLKNLENVVSSADGCDSSVSSNHSNYSNNMQSNFGRSQFNYTYEPAAFAY